MSEHDADCELLGPGKYCTCGLDALMGRLLVDSLRQELAECRGDDAAANPSKWSHATQIAGLREHLKAAEQHVATLASELKRVWSVLPEPVWNERGVLVWSMLDIERIRLALAAARGETR